VSPVVAYKKCCVDSLNILSVFFHSGRDWSDSAELTYTWIFGIRRGHCPCMRHFIKCYMNGLCFIFPRVIQRMDLSVFISYVYFRKCLMKYSNYYLSFWREIFVKFTESPQFVAWMIFPLYNWSNSQVCKRFDRIGTKLKLIW
jgi:hypothetical protein